MASSRFVLSVGDWDGSGHGLKREYIVTLASGRTVEEAREAHRSIPSRYDGKDIDSILADYEDWVHYLIIKHNINILSGDALDMIAAGWVALMAESNAELGINIDVSPLEKFHTEGIAPVGYREAYSVLN